MVLHTLCLAPPLPLSQYKGTLGQSQTATKTARRECRAQQSKTATPTTQAARPALLLQTNRRSRRNLHPIMRIWSVHAQSIPLYPWQTPPPARRCQALGGSHGGSVHHGTAPLWWRGTAQTVETPTPGATASSYAAVASAPERGCSQNQTLRDRAGPRVLTLPGSWALCLDIVVRVTAPPPHLPTAGCQQRAVAAADELRLICRFKQQTVCLMKGTLNKMFGCKLCEHFITAL